MTPVAQVHDLVIGPADGAPIVDGVSFTVPAGRVLGLVGRSGSGKTTAAHALLGHLRPGLRVVSGTVRVAGQNPFRSAATLRGRVVSHLGQDPAAALNPARRIGAQLAEAIRLRTGTQQSTVNTELTRLLTAVDLPTDRAFRRRFSHQISGGQAQRVGLAIALAGSPRLLILDEPTSSLDTVVAAEIRTLLRDLLAAPEAPAAVLITHDPHLVANLADDIVTMPGGRRIPRFMGGTSYTMPTAVSSRQAHNVYDVRPGLIVESLSARHDRRLVVEDVSVRIGGGTTLALVGPSGSGKTTIARSIVGLHPRGTGRILLDGEPLAPFYRDRTRAQRRAVQLVAQDAVGALNPRETVRAALLRPLRARLSEREAQREVSRLLDRVHLPETCATRVPGELSGGERQRVNLCRALAAEPRLLVCDEVTSALDQEIAAAVLDLLAELRTALGLAVLLITHDLSVAAASADEIAVLDRGRIIETGPTATVLSAPAHELTRALVTARSA